jgi:hypothetical protein
MPERIPENLAGQASNILADVLLLGLTADPRAIPPLLKVMDAANRETFWQEFSSQGYTERFRESNFAVVHPGFIADALDRIFSNASHPRNAEYMQWRSAQNFLPREPIVLFPYDSARTPYDAAGLIGGPGVGSAGPTINYDEPLMIAPASMQEPAANGYLTNARIEWIIEFARRSLRDED